MKWETIYPESSFFRLCGSCNFANADTLRQLHELVARVYALNCAFGIKL